MHAVLQILTTPVRRLASVKAVYITPVRITRLPHPMLSTVDATRLSVAQRGMKRREKTQVQPHTVCISVYRFLDFSPGIMPRGRSIYKLPAVWR